MQQSKEQRAHQLGAIQTLLTSDAGKELMAELATTWDQFMLIGETPEVTAYNVGLRDAYKFLQGLQAGEFNG